MIAVLRELKAHIERLIGEEVVINMQLGYHQSEPITLGDSEGLLAVFVEDAVHMWAVKDSEWQEPEALVEQVISRFE